MLVKVLTKKINLNQTLKILKEGMQASENNRMLVLVRKDNVNRNLKENFGKVEALRLEEVRTYRRVSLEACFESTKSVKSRKEMAF
jgi:hypothetical protein